MKKNYLFTILTVTALAACSVDNDSQNTASLQQQPICFTAEDETDEATRATTVSDDQIIVMQGTEADRPLVVTATVQTAVPEGSETRGVRLGGVDDLNIFGVSASKTVKLPDAEQIAAATTDFFYNLPATRNTNDVFQIAQDFYWPSDDERLNFYAYAPYGDGSGVELAAREATGPQKLTYTVNSNVSAQKDLVTAAANTTAFTTVTGDSKKAAVPLAFTHELTAIRFVIGEQWLAGSIKSVAIKGVHGKGTTVIGSHTWDWVDKEGNDITTLDNFTLTLDKTGLQGTDNEEIIDDASLYFLMIPQSFDNNSTAVLEVVYQDGAKDYTLTASLQGVTWVRNTTVTYAISSHALTTLRIGNIAWPTAGTWEGPKTDFEAGDEIGLYVAGGTDGKTIVHQNVRCSYNGSAWTIHHPTGNPVYKLPGLQYFFYYPYTSTPDTNYPLQGKSLNTSATDFFSTLIEGWTPAANQNDLQKLNRQDLQVAKGVDNATIAPAIDALMAHQMNMGIITLGTKNAVPNDVTYKLDDTYKWYHGADGTSSNVPASANFADNLPYTHTDGKNYYVFKPVTNPVNQPGTLIKALNSNQTADWSYYLQSTATSTKIEQTVYTSVTTYSIEKNYALAIGDIYYSNGAISHNLITTASNANYANPVGIVFKTSTSTPDTNAGFTHGYVVAGKNSMNHDPSGEISVCWNVKGAGDTYDEISGITGIYWNTGNVITAKNYIMNINMDGNCGRYNTSLIPTTDNFPAFKSINDYNTASATALSTSAVTQANIHWYMPSIGEWFYVFDNLGGFSNATLITANTEEFDVISDNNVHYVEYANTLTVVDNVNNYLHKLGTGKYEDFHNPNDGITRTANHYWSSSVRSESNQYAFSVDVDVDGQIAFVVYTVKSRGYDCVVRPILCF